MPMQLQTGTYVPRTLPILADWLARTFRGLCQYQLIGWHVRSEDYAHANYRLARTFRGLCPYQLIGLHERSKDYAHTS